MKKAKYILIGGAILIFVANMLRFLWEPHSLSELFDVNYLSITPEKGTSSFNYFNIQEYNGEKYFSDKGNLVSQKADSDKKEIQVKNVHSFLIRDDELVYTLFDDTDKMYVKNLQNNKVKNISIKNADILLNDDEYVYIYSKKNILHKFDRLWNEEKTIDLKQNGFKKRFERACIISGKLVFATESLKLYIYDEQEETLHKVKQPKGEDHSEDGDIMQWNGNVYYMRCYYNDGDFHNSFTRVDSSYNGIYRLNIDNKELEKVSNEAGEIMLIMNNQVYIAASHFLGLSYRIKSADVEYAARMAKREDLSDKKNEESIGREKIFESNVTKINISTLPPSKGILDNFEITDAKEIDAIKNYFETIHAKETDKDINEYAGMSYLLQLECDGKKAKEINLMGNMFVITGEEIEEAPYEEMVAFDGVLAGIILNRYQKDKEITPVIGEVKKVIQKEKETRREIICMIGTRNRKINITDSYIYDTIQNEGWCDLHKGDRVKLYLKENDQDAEAVFIVN